MMNIQDGSTSLFSDKIIEAEQSQSLFQLGYRIKFALILIIILFIIAGVSYLVKIHHSPSLLYREVIPLRYSSNTNLPYNHPDNPSSFQLLSGSEKPGYLNLSSMGNGEELDPAVKEKIQDLFLSPPY